MKQPRPEEKPAEKISSEKPDQDKRARTESIGFFNQAKPPETPKPELSPDDKQRASAKEAFEEPWRHYSRAREFCNYIYTKNSDDWRMLAKCNEELGNQYLGQEIFQLALPHYREGLECCAQISVAERKPPEQEMVARLFSKLIDTVNGLLQHVTSNSEMVLDFLDFYLKKYDFFTRDKYKSLKLEGIALYRLKSNLAECGVRKVDALGITIRIIAAVIEMFRSDADLPNPKLRVEVDSLRALGASNKDESLQKAFDLFERALLQTPALHLHRLTPEALSQDTFAVPMSPTRASGSPGKK